MKQEYCESSESVTEGHPDKVCDQISDAILDACLVQDPLARVAIETMVSGDTVVVAGELATSAKIQIEPIVRRVIADIGYQDKALGFDSSGCFIITNVRTQSADISQGVSRGRELGAGDQGIFYGYACDETSTLMPLPLYLAHELTKALAKMRHEGILPWLRPDGKAQVTLRYNAAGKAEGLDSVVVSTQHDTGINKKMLVQGIVSEIIYPVLHPWLQADTRFHINPTGRFVIGGPVADTGLTGRKIMVDTYGGRALHGGGAFSGKDPTKVDRSGAYMARYIAKNIVAAGLAAKCQVALAFAIGQTDPEMVTIETFGTETVAKNRLHAAVKEIFSLSVSGIISSLDLRRSIYEATASYGHFGRVDQNFPWEQTHKSSTLQELCLP